MADPRYLAQAVGGVSPDPGDQSANYNTPLNPQQEAAFLQWQKANPRLGNTYDYDARGFWLHGAQQGANGHGDDRWKKPNHPTFSTGSDYSGPYTPGGTWAQLPGGAWQFNASPYNLHYQDAGDLQAYWNRIEAPHGNKLVLPAQSQAQPVDPIAAALVQQALAPR